MILATPESGQVLTAKGFDRERFEPFNVAANELIARLIFKDKRLFFHAEEMLLIPGRDSLMMKMCGRQL